MDIAALCPTYRRPELLRNSIALWQQQLYPSEHCKLYVLDDGGTFSNQTIGENVVLMSADRRFPSLPDKYNALLDIARVEHDWDAYLVWEDDDIYLPHYVGAHQSVLLYDHKLSKPESVFSDYDRPTRGVATIENAKGRFHSSLCISRQLMDACGGWPKTFAKEFDQIFIAKLFETCKENGWSIGSPNPECFCYRWHLPANYTHGQEFMQTCGNTDWYRHAASQLQAVPFLGKCVPQLDSYSEAIIAEILYGGSI